MDEYRQIFKYTDFDGARAILAGQKLKFSRPSLFNDIFDVSIQSIASKPLENFLPEVQAANIDLIFSNEPLPKFNSSTLASQAQNLIKKVKNVPFAKRAVFRFEIENDPIEKTWDLMAMELKNKETITEIQKNFKDDGIFCASVRPDNILLWAHYANHHKGAVIELEANLAEDSALRLATAVEYSSERPHLFQSGKEMLHHALFEESDKITQAFMRKVIFTKSLEWSAEEEIRVWIPEYIPHGNSNFLPLRSKEIRAVYFGYRTQSEERNTLMKIAKDLDKNILFYEMKPHIYDYRLEAIPL